MERLQTERETVKKFMILQKKREKFSSLVLNIIEPNAAGAAFGSNYNSGIITRMALLDMLLNKCYSFNMVFEMHFESKT